MSGRRRALTVSAVLLATLALTAGTGAARTATATAPATVQQGVVNPPLHCGDTSTELADYPDRGLTLPHVALPATEVHPGVDFTAADVPTLRARATGAAADPHGLYARDWGKIAADVAAGSTGGKSADDIDSRRAKAYGFHYVVTGDPADRATAIDALTHAFDTIEDDDLDIAAQVTTYSQAYDYVAASIPRGSAEDVAIRAAVKRGAQWLADWLQHHNPDGSNPRPHNHRSKAALGLGLWSLVFATDPAARGWFDLAQDQIASTYSFMFTHDGIYLDGYGYYWDFQLFQLVPYLYAVRNLTGVDLFTPMRPAFEWMVRDSTPQGHLPNIEDGWLKLTWTAVVAPAYRHTGTLLSGGPLADVLQWRFFNQDWAAVQYPDLGTNSWTGASNQIYLWPDELSHVDGSIPERQPDRALHDHYTAGGNTTVLRSDWRYGDPRTRWVMFYGAPQSNNHDHCDVMQVLLDAENTTLLNDDGYGPTRFTGRADWFPAAQHNVVTMDGNGSNDVFANTAEITGRFGDYAEKLAYYDQTRPGVPGTSWWRRGVLFAAKDYVVITDTLHSPTSRSWDEYLHNRGDLQRSGNAATWTTQAGIFGPSAKTYAYLLPRGADATTQSGQDNLYGATATPPATEPNHYLDSRQQGTDAQYLTLAVPRSTSAAAPRFTDVSPAGGRVLAATVRDGAHVDTVLARRSGGIVAADGISTDGRLAWVRRTGGVVTAWQVVGATRLDVAGRPLLRSSTPVSATGTGSTAHLFTGSGRPTIHLGR